MLTAGGVLDQVFLDVRAKLLEVAASLDRISRADGAEAAFQDPRWQQLQQAISVLADEGFSRAEQVQLLFSDPYVAGWQQQWQLQPR